MSVKIHGKEYQTVAERLSLFHKDHSNGSIRTEIIKELSNGDFVTIMAVVIPDIEKPIRYFTGHAREVFTKTGINQTSAYENCETSAIGRALASAGYLGTEFASADEVAVAIQGQAKTAVDTFKGTVIEVKPKIEKENNIISEPQKKRLFNFMKESGVPNDVVKQYMRDKWKIESSHSITKGEMYEDICNFIQNFGPKE